MIEKYVKNLYYQFALSPHSRFVLIKTRKLRSDELITWTLLFCSYLLPRIYLSQVQLKLMRNIQDLTRLVSFEWLAVNQTCPKVKLSALLLAAFEAVSNLFKVKRKNRIFVLQFVFMRKDLGFLSKLRLDTVLLELALVFDFLMFFNFNEELLCMGSDLGAGSCFNKVLNLFPIFPIEFESVEEFFMFFFGPSASCFGLM